MSDTRFIFATALLSSVCFSAQALALTTSDVAASNLIHTDTYTSTPSAEPAASFAQLDKTYKLAGVGDCGGAGGGEYDSFGESLDVPGSYLCQNAGYKTCASGQIGNPATVCPDDENYFKECKCNYAEMTPGTYNNNCGPLATVSTCKDTTGDYYLCSCASDSMTRCNQSNELLLDKSQYCQNPKEGTRWYGKGACLVCTAPKVPNSSTKTCSCPTNYKVCTSPSVGVGTGCEDNGVMKYASCECPADYVTCRWGPAPGSASCNTGSGLRYKSCKPDPKTCEEWIQYEYGTPRDVVISGTWSEDITIFKDTHLATASVGSFAQITAVNYDYAPEGLCTGRTNPTLTIDKLTAFHVESCSSATIYVSQASSPSGFSTGSNIFACDLIADNIDSTGYVSLDPASGNLIKITGTLTSYDSTRIGGYGKVDINNLVVSSEEELWFYGGGYGDTWDDNRVNTLTYTGTEIEFHLPLTVGTLKANFTKSYPRGSYYSGAQIEVGEDLSIDGDGIFINAANSTTTYTSFRVGPYDILEMKKMLLEDR